MIKLLFTPVSITPLIDTEDACFGLNASRPIAKGDLKWRDALLVAQRVNRTNIQLTVIKKGEGICVDLQDLSEKLMTENRYLLI